MYLNLLYIYIYIYMNNKNNIIFKIQDRVSYYTANLEDPWEIRFDQNTGRGY